MFAGLFAVALALVALAPAPHAQQTAGAGAPQALLDRIWRGVKDAEAIRSGCGTLTETRESPLAVRPLVLNGTFCAVGRDRFRVDYAPPHAIRLVYRDGALNVSSDGGKLTEALYVRDSVTRGQEYFSGPRARANLERDFSISATESADGYRLLLLPVSGRLAKRVTRVVVELARTNFLPRLIAVHGKTGTTSTYVIHVDKVNPQIDDSLFNAYNPKPRR